MPSAQPPARTAITAPAIRRGAAIPACPASGGTMRAAAATPRGVDICLMPIARPRRERGNQPITTRPEAALVLAAAAPPSSSRMPIAVYPRAAAAAKAKTAVSARPPAITHRSP